MNKAYIKYIECKIYYELKEAGRVQLENKNIPTQPKISESDIATMEEYKSNIYLILGTLGYPDINKKIIILKDTDEGVQDSNEKEKTLESFIFYLKLKKHDIAAKMVSTTSGLMVLSGSVVAPVGEKYRGSSSVKATHLLQKKLIESNNLVQHKENLLLKTNILFSKSIKCRTICIRKKCKWTKRMASERR